MKKKFPLEKSSFSRFSSRRVSTLLAFGATAIAFQALEANATTSFSELPDMGNLTQLAVFGSKDNNSNVTINGSVGIAPGGTLQHAGPSTINGNVYLGVGATKTGPGSVSGTVFSGANTYGTINLAAAQNEVFTASTTFAGMTPDTVLSGNISGAQTFGSANGVTDINVININGNLTLGSGQNVTFVGDPGDVFVLNITGTLTMSGNATLGTLAQAGMTIVNLTSSGNLGTVAQVNNVINGTILVPNATAATFHSANGAVYSGLGQMTFMSDATINFVPFVPEPSTLLTGAFLLLPLGAGALRIARKR